MVQNGFVFHRCPPAVKVRGDADGSVDWDEDFLSGLDVCVASVQTEIPNTKHLNLPRVQRWGDLSDEA